MKKSKQVVNDLKLRAKDKWTSLSYFDIRSHDQPTEEREQDNANGKDQQGWHVKWRAGRENHRRQKQLISYDSSGYEGSLLDDSYQSSQNTHSLASLFERAPSSNDIVDQSLNTSRTHTDKSYSCGSICCCDENQRKVDQVGLRQLEEESWTKTDNTNRFGATCDHSSQDRDVQDKDEDMKDDGGHKGSQAGLPKQFEDHKQRLSIVRCSNNDSVNIDSGVRVRSASRINKVKSTHYWNIKSANCIQIHSDCSSSCPNVHVQGVHSNTDLRSPTSHNKEDDDYDNDDDNDDEGGDDDEHHHNNDDADAYGDDVFDDVDNNDADADTEILFHSKYENNQDGGPVVIPSVGTYGQQVTADRGKPSSENSRTRGSFPKSDEQSVFLVERTFTLLEPHASDNVVVTCTSVVRRICKGIKLNPAQRVVNIISERVSGRTTTGISILKEFSTEWTPVSVRDEIELDTVLVSARHRKMIVFFDDFLGKQKLELNPKLMKIFGDVLSAVENGRLIWIGSISRHVYEQFITRGVFEQLLDRETLHDISGNLGISFEDRLEILTARIDSVKWSMQIGICEEERDENVHTMKEKDVGSNDIFIWRGTLKRMARDPLPSFPWYAKQFVASYRNILKGQAFFEDSMIFINDEVNSFRESTDEIGIAKCLALTKAWEAAAAEDHCNRKPTKTRKIWTPKRLSQSSSISMVNIIASEKGVHNVDKLIEDGNIRLNGSFLSFDEINRTRFAAKPYMLATAFMLAPRNERNVVLTAPKELIMKRVRLPSTLGRSKNDIPYYIIVSDKATRDALLTRLMDFGLHGDVMSITEHDAIQDIEFAKQFLVKCEKAGVLKTIMSVTDDSCKETILSLGINCSFDGMSGDDPQNFTELLIRQNAPLKADDRKKAVQKCCKEGHVRTYFILNSKTPIDDTESLIMACTHGSKEIVKHLARMLPPGENSKALREVCLVHAESNWDLCRDLCDILTHHGAFFASSSKESPIGHVAVDTGNVPLLEIVHRYGADLDIENTHAESALYVACKSNHKPCAGFLIDIGCSLNGSTGHNSSPVHEASKSKSNEILYMLLKRDKALAEQVDASTRKPIHIAARYNRSENIKTLINYGADINAPIIRSGETALHVAISNHRKNAIDVLLENGANVDAIDIQGRKPFEIACEKGTYEQINKLFEKHDHAGLRNPDSIFLAVKTKRESIIQKKYGSANSKNGDGHTLLHCAIVAGNPTILHALVSKGADVNMKSKNKVPVLEAIKMETSEMFFILFHNGADLQVEEDHTLNTSLHIACRHKKVDIIKAILENHQYLVESRNKQHRTALHEAVDSGCVKAVELLLRSGANRSVFEKERRETPKLIALRRRNQYNNQLDMIDRVREYDEIFALLIRNPLI